jgi:hypothetical protein
LVTLTALALLVPASASGQQFAGEVTQYVDPSQQTLLSFGDESHGSSPGGRTSTPCRHAASATRSA